MRTGFFRGLSFLIINIPHVVDQKKTTDSTPEFDNHVSVARIRTFTQKLSADINPSIFKNNFLGFKALFTLYIIKPNFLNFC